MIKLLSLNVFKELGSFGAIFLKIIIRYLLLGNLIIKVVIDEGLCFTRGSCEHLHYVPKIQIIITNFPGYLVN